MKFDQIIKDLNNKIYKPIYFLQGDESYYIDLITNYIAESVLAPDERSFNQTILYGKDTDARTIDNAARRFPMMANYQVLIVKEAQELKQIEDLVYYASRPLKSTILVINYKYKTFRANSKLIKEITNNGLVFESKKLYDNQVPEWINKYLAAKGYSIEPKTSVLLTEFLGANLSKVSNELDKLALVLPKGTVITAQQVETHIGISKDYNNFELQNAIIKKEILKANRIADYFNKNPRDNPLVVTITVLFNFFTKILMYHFLQDRTRGNVASVLKVNPYFIADYELAAKRYNPKKTVQIISYLREYDLKSKGVGSISATDGDLLKELIYKILH